MVHYRDGRSEEIPILRGQDLRDWLVTSDLGSTRSSSVAWTGTNSNRAPSAQRTWKNPYSYVEIQSLDLVTKMTKCAPFVIAITTEP